MVHRYPDRALVIATTMCSTYCRHCTRKRIAGTRETSITKRRLEQVAAYLTEHPQISDVIVSGGDPLTMSTEQLEMVLARLRAGAVRADHPHRHARAGGAAQRITDELCQMLRKYHPVWINTHFNHPQELTPESSAGLRAARGCRHSAGQPVGAAARGQRRSADHRDSSAAAWCAMRVRPYYMYQCDLVRGVEHFRTPLEPRHGDHGVSARPAQRPGDSHLRGGRPARRRQDSRPADLRRLAEPDAHGAEKLRGHADRLSGAAPAVRGADCRAAGRIRAGSVGTDGRPSTAVSSPRRPCVMPDASRAAARTSRSGISKQMIRIQRVYGSVLPIDQQRIRQAQEIFRQNFSAVASYADKIPDMLDHPFKYGYKTILLVCETAMGKVMGFSLLMHFPEINSSLLDFLAANRQLRGGGIGGCCSRRPRNTSSGSGSRGLYMEVLPDDPTWSRIPALLRENQQRLRFYEYYGIRPIINTEYETPLGESPAPYLLFDDLGRGTPLKRSECPRCRSADPQPQVRPARHAGLRRARGRECRSTILCGSGSHAIIKTPPAAITQGARGTKAFEMIGGDVHVIHHVRDRGYVERPARVERPGTRQRWLRACLPRCQPRHFGEEHLRAVHDSDFLART